MVIIRFVNGREWYKANWVFRQLAEDVKTRFPDDDELKTVMDRAEAFGILRIESLAPEMGLRAVQAMENVANETLQGKIQKWKRSMPEDREGQLDYLEALRELLDLIGPTGGGECRK